MKTLQELLEVTRAMREYIDALPEEVVATLPAMPGFDRDWADNVIADASSLAKPPVDTQAVASLHEIPPCVNVMAGNVKPLRADGGELSRGRLREISDNPYGDEEKRWMAEVLLHMFNICR